MSDGEEYKLAAIMFTDIQGFSKMMEKNERETLELLKYHNDLISELVKKYNGNVIKTIGDAFMVSFGSATNAVNTSIEVQKELYKFNQRQLSLDKRLFVRIGVHLGDIHFFKDDAFGEGINIASRLQSISKPGGICISKDVYNQVFNKIDAKFVDLGKAKLKNISKEIYAFDIMTDFLNDTNYELMVNNDKESKVTEEGLEIKEEDYSNKTKEEIEDRILEKIKGFNRRIPREWIENHIPKAIEHIEPVIEKLIKKGIITKLEKDNGEVEYAFSGIKDLFSCSKETNPQKEIVKFNKKANESLFGIIPHTITFAIVNFFLYKLNIELVAKDPTMIMWSYFVAIFWGNGLLNHIANAILMGHHKNKLNKSITTFKREITLDELELLKNDFKLSEGIIGNIVSFFGVNALLYQINMTFNPNFHWYLFVVAAWGIGVFTHFFKFIKDKLTLKKEIFITRAKNDELQKLGRLEEHNSKKNTPDDKPDYQNKSDLNTKPKKDRDVIINDEYSNILTNALSIRDKLYKKLKSKDQFQTRYDINVIESVDNFITQIKELINLDYEIDEIVKNSSSEEIDIYLNKLKEKLDLTQNDELKNEYSKSITQHEREKQSLIELKDQKEIIHLRIINAISSLKQFEMDFARVKGVISNENDTSIKIFTETSLELSNYVDNIKQSYQNIERTLE